MKKILFQQQNAKLKKEQFALDIPDEDDDFVYVPFRCISAGMVGEGTYKATEFPEEVLKKGMALFKNLNLYTNHWQYVGNEIGSVLEPQWREPYALPNGKLVPAGIEAVVQVDKVTYPDIARKLTKWATPIHSVSVGVSFKYRKSHPEMDDYEFMRNRGKEMEGKVVRVIVEEITKFWELSLVYEGADPNAKRIGKDGKIAVYDADNTDTNEEEGVETLIFNLPIPEAQNQPNLFNTESEMSKPQENIPKVTPTENTPSEELFKFSFNEQEDNTFEEQLNAALAVRGLVATSQEKYNGLLVANEQVETLRATLATQKQAVKDLTEKVEAQKQLTESAQEQLEAQQTERERLESELEALQAKRETEKTIYALGQARIQSLQEQAVHAYTVFAKESLNEKTVETIKAETDVTQLEALIEMYGQKAKEEFGARCADCGSEQVQFRSSEPAADNTQAQERVEASTTNENYVERSMMKKLTEE